VGVKLLQSNFAAGELSKRIRASGDLERYAAGLDTALNLTILPLGAAERRSGSIWVADPADPTLDAKLLAFVREVGVDVVAIVINNGKLRFIDVLARAYLEDGGGDPIEVASSWTAADYPYLFSWQSADVVWIGDRRGTAPVQVLKRQAGVWQALGELELRNGPFLPDAGVTVTPSGVVGAVNLVTSGAAFEAGHVGALLGMRANAGAPPHKRWLANDASISDGAPRYNAGRVYFPLSGGPPTGTNSPIHDEGTVSDGVVDFQYLHDGLGVVRITAVTDATHAAGTVEARLPFQSGSVATPYWGFGAFSDVAGWPRAGCVHQERFVLGGAAAQPDVTHLSRVEGYGPDFADFKAGLGTGLVVDSDAVRRALNSGSLQQVLHYVSFERLYCFTAEGVYAIGGPSIDEPITPASASARARTAFGAHPLVGPVKTGDSILYVTAAGEELRELAPDAAEAPNATVLADHIGSRGFAELAFQRSPYPLLWARLADGGLASMTYERLERVRAWARQSLGGDGVVSSAIALPGPGGREELWCVVKRTIDGADRYSIEVIPPPWRRERQAWELACALDSAGYFDFWNADAENRAKLTVLDEELRAAQVETEADSFTAGDVGVRLALRLAAPANGFDPGEAAQIARVDVLEYVDAKIVRGRLITDGAADLAGAWTVHWAKMETTLEVGARLEGATVDVFGDGQAQRGLTVSGGDVTLSEPVARGWVGLPFRFELVDLPVAQAGYGTAFGGAKKIERAWVVAEYATPGLTLFDPSGYGGDCELVLREAAAATDRPASAADALVAAAPHGAWSDAGQLGVRQDNPFPVLLLGIVKEVAT